MFKLAHFYSHVALNYFLLLVSGQAHLKRTTDPNREDDVKPTESNLNTGEALPRASLVFCSELLELQSGPLQVDEAE